MRLRRRVAPQNYAANACVDETALICLTVHFAFSRPAADNRVTNAIVGFRAPTYHARTEQQVTGVAYSACRVREDGRYITGICAPRAA